MKLWITGSQGMLGQDLCRIADSSNIDYVASDRDVDITDKNSVMDFITKYRPNTIINCAAYTAVDLAETEKELNNKINALGPEVLGECSAKANANILHISTDYVLNGNPPEPLLETAELNPQNEYGRAKACGELAIAKANKNHWIIRTAWLYGIYGKNFVKTMLNLMRTKEKISVVQDQQGNPTWTVDLALALLIIAQNPTQPGIYNFSGEGVTNWYDFAKEIQNQSLNMNLLEKKIDILPVSSSEYKTAAKRPLWSSLDKTKIKSVFNVNIPDWRHSLSQYLRLEK